MKTRVVVDRAWLTRLFTEGESVNITVAKGLPKFSRLVSVNTDKKDMIVFEFASGSGSNIEAETTVEYEQGGAWPIPKPKPEPKQTKRRCL